MIRYVQISIFFFFLLPPKDVGLAGAIKVSQWSMCRHANWHAFSLAKCGKLSSLHSVSMDNSLYYMSNGGLEHRPSVRVVNEVLPSAFSRSISISGGQIVIQEPDWALFCGSTLRPDDSASVYLRPSACGPQGLMLTSCKLSPTKHDRLHHSGKKKENKIPNRLCLVCSRKLPINCPTRSWLTLFSCCDITKRWFSELVRAGQELS